MMRQATLADLRAIVAVIENARAFLKRQGIDQWQTSSYPNVSDVSADIETGVGYVLEIDGEIAGYAAVITGFDPAYDKIQDGAWLNDNRDYVTIHRLALSDQFRGRALAQQFFRAIFAEFSSYHDFRCDTHTENQIMQHILTKLGFEKCGIVLFEGARLAFQSVGK
ncbi:N-acetyltransferase [Lactococcus hodotermopsidis]|uniref:N-acetyltransferase n=1 Tax=Pseudolactococcus hodotermopsidis TaxID=2709157 RepID=A0A6A0BAK4_9LACT|nr:GNAT family N-acetyltransferase [Lactococcus hodotermopsidis]GFH41488.1 N-acetyltransferase [Lactococcus hodotermopsidis]